MEFVPASCTLNPVQWFFLDFIFPSSQWSQYKHASLMYYQISCLVELEKNADWIDAETKMLYVPIIFEILESFEKKRSERVKWEPQILCYDCDRLENLEWQRRGKTRKLT